MSHWRLTIFHKKIFLSYGISRACLFRIFLSSLLTILFSEIFFFFYFSLEIFNFFFHSQFLTRSDHIRESHLISTLLFTSTLRLSCLLRITFDHILRYNNIYFLLKVLRAEVFLNQKFWTSSNRGDWKSWWDSRLSIRFVFGWHYRLRVLILQNFIAIVPSFTIFMILS